MRMALVLKQKEQDEVDRHISQAIVFNVEDGKVVGVENETVEAGNFTSLSTWALANKIKTIYLPAVDEWVRTFFWMMGITMKAYDESVDDKLFQTFIL